MDNHHRTALAPDFSVSKVIIGLWQIADMEKSGKTLDPDSTAQAMTPYHASGLTTFDMADHYGSSEIIAGRFRAGLADQGSVQLLTKWVPNLQHRSKDDVRAAIQLALDRLDSDQIDLLQYHAWNYADPVWIDHLTWLQDLKNEGLIGNLGATNFDATHLNIALSSGIKIVSNQISYSLLDQRAAGEMAIVCERHGVKILAFGTLAGGFLSEKWLGQPDPAIDSLKSWSQQKYRRFIDVTGGWDNFQTLLATLSKIAKRKDQSIANIASRYILDQPSTGAVIIGARLGESEHLADNLALMNIVLDEASRSAINSALENLAPIPGDCGDEYRKPPFLTASGDLSHHLEEMPLPYTPVAEGNGATRVFSGVPWEELAGYCRAIRRGDHIYVSGTTASHGAQTIGGRDVEAQTHFALDKIEGALLSLGSSLDDVVRTRIYVRNIDDWEIVAAVHGNRLGHVQPANTLVSADLVGDDLLVEIEVDAEIQN